MISTILNVINSKDKFQFDIYLVIIQQKFV